MPEVEAREEGIPRRGESHAAGRNDERNDEIGHLQRPLEEEVEVGFH
jgi:hypothetical protein